MRAPVRTLSPAAQAPPALALPALALPALALWALALLWGLAALLALTGCERKPAPLPPPPPVASQTAAQPAPGADTPFPVILFLGDSLTAGYGLPGEESFPARIQQRLEAAGYPHRVVNAGVSGDTSAGGRARLDWLLRQRVDVLVLALGANDGLRGLDPRAMQANLARIIERARARGITVVLAGMHMPSNYGPDYTRAFRAVFPALAERHGVAFIPFLLEGVALRGDLNQADGIHPNAEGARIVADTVWAVLEPVLKRQRP